MPKKFSTYLKNLIYLIYFPSLFCRMNKIVLVTGATSGIGKACAEKYASNKHDIIITGRREERLAEIKKNLEESYGVRVLTLCFDVQDKKAVFSSVSSIPPEWQAIEILINNAGLAIGKDYFDEADMDDWE